MAISRFLAAALFAASSTPALAGALVVGNGAARSCYEAADAVARPTMRDLQRCNDAIVEPGLSYHDLVATHVNRGIVLLRNDRIDESLADFDRAIALDPGQAEAYLNKGAALLRRNDMSGALPLFTVALERHTIRPAIAHYGRAVANEGLGNLAAAYRDYQMASQLDPDWQAPRIELGRFRIRDR